MVIYPIPAKEFIIIENPSANDNVEVVEIQIIDFLGRILNRNTEVEFRKSKYKLDISQLAGGTYYIKILTNDSKQIQPIVVMK